MSHGKPQFTCVIQLSFPCPTPIGASISKIYFVLLPKHVQSPHQVPFMGTVWYLPDKVQYYTAHTSVALTTPTTAQKGILAARQSLWRSIFELYPFLSPPGHPTTCHITPHLSENNFQPHTHFTCMSSVAVFVYSQ